MDEKMSLDELKKQYSDLGAEIARREKAEAEERKAKLAAEKEARRNKIEEVFDQLESLLAMWCEDYGPYKRNIPRSSHDWNWFI